MINGLQKALLTNILKIVYWPRVDNETLELMLLQNRFIDLFDHSWWRGVRYREISSCAAFSLFVVSVVAMDTRQQLRRRWQMAVGVHREAADHKCHGGSTGNVLCGEH